MIDSTHSGDVVDECAAGSAELVVEADGGGEGEEALEDAFSEALEGAGAVAFEGEEVFAGPEDRFDPLADRGEVWAFSRFVFAARPDDGGVEGADAAGEVAAGVALVAEDRLAAVALAAFEQSQPDLALVVFGGDEHQRPGGAVRGEERVEPETPEIPRVGGAVAVVGGVRELGASHGLTAAGALDRGRVDQEQIVVVAGAPAREHVHEPLQRLAERTAALEVRRLARDHREQVREALPRDLEEATVARDPHDRLRHTPRDHLGVCERPTRVPRLLGQEIVSCAINRDAESVEVGVPRGLQVNGVFGTADFDLSAQNPLTTAQAVESLI